MWHRRRPDVFDGLRHCDEELVVENPYDSTGIDESVVVWGLQAAMVSTVAQ